MQANMFVFLESVRVHQCVQREKNQWKETVSLTLSCSNQPAPHGGVPILPPFPLSSPVSLPLSLSLLVIFSLAFISLELRLTKSTESHILCWASRRLSSRGSCHCSAAKWCHDRRSSLQRCHISFRLRSFLFYSSWCWRWFDFFALVSPGSWINKWLEMKRLHHTSVQ